MLSDYWNIFLDILPPKYSFLCDFWYFNLEYMFKLEIRKYLKIRLYWSFLDHLPHPSWVQGSLPWSYQSWIFLSEFWRDFQQAFDCCFLVGLHLFPLQRASKFSKGKAQANVILTSIHSPPIERFTSAIFPAFLCSNISKYFIYSSAFEMVFVRKLYWESSSLWF